jgi:hypothetical protein
VPFTRELLICTLAVACVLQVSPAAAFCSKPIAPFCVEDESLSENFIPEERCRRALEHHVEDLTNYRQCLTAEIGQIDAAVERFKNLLNGDAEKSRSLPATPVTPDEPATAQAAG